MLLTTEGTQHARPTESFGRATPPHMGWASCPDQGVPHSISPFTPSPKPPVVPPFKHAKTQSPDRNLAGALS